MYLDMVLYRRYYIGMIQMDAQREIEAMGLIRTAEALEEIEALYLQNRTDKMVLTSAFIHQQQKAIIDLIAMTTGKGKAEVLRDMIDEWVEIKLRGNGQ